MFFRSLLPLNILVSLLAMSALISADLWQDELYTLFHFVKTDIDNTILDYHSTNNHILFNLINNFWLRIVNIFGSPDLLSHSWILRILPAVYSVLASWVVYRSCKRFWGEQTALIAVSILLTTVPFLGFSTQFRGYSLAILIATAQFFNLLSVAGSADFGFRQWISVAFYSGLSLLCLPTNLYLELSYLLILANTWAFPGICSAVFGKPLPASFFRGVISASLVFTVPVLIFYKWRLSQYPAMPFLETPTLFCLPSLRQIPAVFYHFMGWRFYLPVLAVIGLVIWLRALPKTSFNPSLLPMLLFVLPFVFLFVSGALIIQRIFLVLIPFFVISLSLLLAALNPSIKRLIIAVNIAVFIAQVIWATSALRNANREEVHHQDLVMQYYLVDFNPESAFRKSIELSSKYDLPVYLKDGFGETGLKYYFESRSFAHTKLESADLLPAKGIIVTNLKNETKAQLKAEHRKFEVFFDPENHYQVFLIQN